MLQTPEPLMITERLTLRRMTEADAPFYLDMVSDPDFRYYIADRGVRTLADATELLRSRVIAAYEQDGFGMFLVSRRDNQRPVGMAGLVRRDFLDDIDVGYSMLPEGRGQGFATEAADACINFARDHLACRRLAAITHVENDASMRVLSRLGFRTAGTVEFPEDGETCNLFLRDLS